MQTLAERVFHKTCAETSAGLRRHYIYRSISDFEIKKKLIYNFYVALIQ